MSANEANPSEASTDQELQQRGHAAYTAQSYEECEDAFTELARRDSGSQGDAYNAACCAALRGNEDGAWSLLELITSKGWQNVEYLKTDPDLAGLRDDPRWADIISGAQANLDRYFETINRELYEIYSADQGDRQTPDIDWAEVAPRDQQRHDRVLEIVAAGEAKAAEDWFHAAMVMQHGGSLEDYERAHEWAKRAAELDPNNGSALWLAAAAMDRLLMHQGKPQLYGTQYINGEEGWKLYEVDPNTTDEERARWNVPTLAEAQARVGMMNGE